MNKKLLDNPVVALVTFVATMAFSITCGYNTCEASESVEVCSVQESTDEVCDVYYESFNLVSRTVESEEIEETEISEAEEPEVSEAEEPVAIVKKATQRVTTKTWMPHTKSKGGSIFSTKSRQYRLQQLCSTDSDGFRMYDNRYCVALGSYYTVEIGQYFDLVLENGVVIPCVLGDGKADCDTDSMNAVTVATQCMSEFIVDRNVFKDKFPTYGNVSKCNDVWNSPVVEVRLYSINALDEVTL